MNNFGKNLVLYKLQKELIFLYYLQISANFLVIFNFFRSAICAKIDEVNLLSFISFSWIFSFLWSAYRGRVDDHIKWTCSVFDSANVNMTRSVHYICAFGANFLYSNF